MCVQVLILHPEITAQPGLIQAVQVAEPQGPASLNL